MPSGIAVHMPTEAVKHVVRVWESRQDPNQQHLPDGSVTNDRRSAEKVDEVRCKVARILENQPDPLDRLGHPLTDGGTWP